MASLHIYEDAGVQASELARQVAQQICDSLAQKPRCTLILAGGSTPKRFLAALASLNLDWSNIDVLPSDERWVPPESDRANGAMLHAHLQSGPACAATLYSLYRADLPLDDAVAALQQAIAPLLPGDIVVLGMGEDGHTASLFPDGDRLEDALSPDCPESLLPMRATGAAEPRVTLTAPVLTACRHIHLLLVGAEKKRVLDKVLKPGAVADAPVRIVTQLNRTEIHYAYQ